MPLAQALKQKIGCIKLQLSAPSSTDRVLVFGTSDVGSIPTGRILKTADRPVFLFKFNA